MLHRAKKLNPEAVVVAAGCYVQVASDALKEDDSVDIIVGNNNKARLADILEEYMKDRQGDEDGYVLDMPGREYEELHVSVWENIPGHLSRSRTAATSSAATALSPMPEAGSEAGSRRMWRLRLKAGGLGVQGSGAYGNPFKLLRNRAHGRKPGKGRRLGQRSPVGFDRADSPG